MADNPITLILFRRNDRVSKRASARDALTMTTRWFRMFLFRRVIVRASLADALLSYLEVPYGCTYRDR
jgi:hypothetical protein